MTPLWSKKSELTDNEWMSLINTHGEGLPPCCGNISSLRDEIISMARDGCTLAPWNGVQILRAYRVACDGHTFTEDAFPALLKLLREVAESMGYTLEQVHELPHKGNGE